MKHGQSEDTRIALPKMVRTTWELLLPYGCYLSNQHVLDWSLPVSVFSICLYTVHQVAVALSHTDALLGILSESEILQKLIMSFFQIL